MNLTEALQETGCAIFVDKQCTTSVERLTDSEFLLMTRRGVCILECRFISRGDVTFALRFDMQAWTPAEVQFVPKGQAAILFPKNATVDIVAQWAEGYDE